MAKFLNDWDTKNPIKDMAQDFQISIKELESINIIVASYTYENYTGDAFVLFEKGGVFYEVNGSHCSCYGLENQWEPEETDIDVLEKRFTPSDEQFYCQGYEYSYSKDKLVSTYGKDVLKAIKEVREMYKEEATIN